MPLEPPWYSIDSEVERSGANSNERTAGSAIIIDNGSSELRAGFASIDEPQPTLSPKCYFPNVVSRYRDRKKNSNFILAGRDAFCDNQSRSAIKSPFDGDVVCNFDVIENVLDYTFIKLGITSEGSVSHPILMSETLCNPAYSRSMLNELFFEGYNVPSVNYGLDALYSAYYNDVSDGLIVSSGNASTYVLPMLASRGVLSNAKRLTWGGSLATEYLLKLCQMKYPNFPLRVSSNQAALMLERHSYVAEDFDAEVRACATPEGLAERDVVVQFPNATNADGSSNVIHLDGTTSRIVGSVLDADDAEAKAAEQAEKRRQQGLRLQEQTQRMRAEKMQQKENDLEYWMALREFKNKERKAEYLKRLESEGFDTEQELETTIKRTQAALKRSRARGGGAVVEEEEQAPPSFPLIDVPDHSLDEEGVKEKRRQKLMKAGYDARMRMKAEKAEEARLIAEEQQRDEDERLNRPEEWRKRMRGQYEKAIEKILERRRLKKMLSDRKSLAAQQRMKSITTLASDSPPGKKRRRGGDDDTFGADDEDWAVYKEIKGAEDSEEEEEEQQHFEMLESRLLEHDPNFTTDDTWKAQIARKTQLSATFLRGRHLQEWDSEDPLYQHQLHLNVERFRVPEVLFQPHMAGIDQAGLDELCAHILKNYDGITRRTLAKNVFLTGQHTQYRNLDSRLRASLQMTQPIDVQVRVIRAQSMRFDAWRGMAKWVSSCADDFRTSSITRAEYDEKGSEYFKDHGLSAAMMP
ncbi:actin-like ATPase domain-containing protein [Tilletiaria anomala UBC 951]|uniref:Actin-like ATPase domain-containing protein n=1 Tax=Tilletiaria anomala (strain ATCC 24038 / CBS 436.72 / UBC 951) TaxID=1037660 RepID=A0A066WJR7_TILAU|nr:actin-like ATPase domain-containing protein [Tilletiaria anomala UBC 951]KDN50875.1 actin-like ATPase domain-containing protein [Tilletiaria anomala UBC 951]